MGGAQTLSSAAGPAKWAAVVVLSAACGAGLTWSAVRGRASGAVTPPRPAAQQAPVQQVPTQQPAPVQKTPKAAPAAGAEQSTAAPLTGTQPPAKPAEHPAAPEPTPAAPAQPVTTLPPEPAPAQTPLPGAPAKAPGLTHLINVNTAAQAELELLPHVGPAIAKRILDYRALHGPFKTIADLDKVKGIGPKTLAKIAPLVTVE